MRIPFRFILMSLALNLVLLGVVIFDRAPVAAAQSACPAVHIVQPGEWLALIARNYDTTVSELIRLNPWLFWNPNWVPAGARLCVPAPVVPSTQLPSQVTLLAEYQYIPNAEDERFQLHSTTWQYRKRVELPLQPVNGVAFVTDTQELRSTLLGSPHPILVVKSNEPLPNPQTYTLYEVFKDKPKILPALQISTTRALTIPEGPGASPLIETLEVGKVSAVTVTLELAAPNGMSMPFSITGLGIIPEDRVDKLMDPARLALYVLPSDNNQESVYRLKARLGINGAGTDGSKIRWQTYYGPPGWGYYFISYFYYGRWW